MKSHMNEYYSDEGAVASSVKALMNLTVDELMNSNRVIHNFKIMTNEIIEVEQLNYELIDQMTYTELLTMIDLSRDKKYNRMYCFTETECPSTVYNLFNYKVLLAIIIESAKTLTPLKLFLEMPMKSFYVHLCKLTDNPRMAYRNFVSKVKEMHGEYPEDITIRELLTKIYEKVYRDWGLVDMPAASYEKMILRELELARYILLILFADAFPERFDDEALRSNYAKH